MLFELDQKNSQFLGALSNVDRVTYIKIAIKHQVLQCTTHSGTLSVFAQYASAVIVIVLSLYKRLELDWKVPITFVGNGAM